MSTKRERLAHEATHLLLNIGARFWVHSRYWNEWDNDLTEMRQALAKAHEELESCPLEIAECIASRPGA